MAQYPLSVMQIVPQGGYKDLVYFSYWGKHHYGEDLVANFVPLYASCPGELISILYASDTGNYIVYKVLAIGSVWYLRYLHLSEIYVNKGMQNEGTMLARTGNSGGRKNAQGVFINYAPHLHRDVSRDRIGNFVDPKWFDSEVLNINKPKPMPYEELEGWALVQNPGGEKSFFKYGKNHPFKKEIDGKQKPFITSYEHYTFIKNAKFIEKSYYDSLPKGTLTAEEILKGDKD